MDSFDIDGYAFELTPLKLAGQLRIVSLIAPVLGAIKGKALNVGALVGGLDGLPELVKMFAASCKVTIPDVAAGKAVPLPAFVDTVFERKPTLLFAWLVECLTLELGDFLAESGQARLNAIVAKYSSPSSSTGKSGASP